MDLYQTIGAQQKKKGKKKQPTGQQEIFANNISDKGLMSKMYKELIQFDSKNKNKTV